MTIALASSPVPRAQWIHSPVVDVALALCWIPFAAIGWMSQDDISHTAGFISITLLISFAHQPLTIALVYGDKRNFDLRRRIFTWTPLVLAIAALVGQYVSLTALAIIAGLWNAEHTLMQRYGIARIYGRKTGQQDGALEKAMLVSWLALTFVWIAADARTPQHIAQTGLRGRNRRGLDVLADLGPLARLVLPAAITIAGLVTLRWLWVEARRGTAANLAKRLYMASTAALFATILVNPIAGFLGLVGAHALEYFIIVHQNIGTRYANVEADGGAPVGRAIRRLGRTGFIAVYIGVVVGFVGLLNRYGNHTTSTVVILTLGGMHVFYDGFIWKRPSSSKGGMLTATT